MNYLCGLLIVICIIECFVILWLRNAEKEKINVNEIVKFFRYLWGRFVFYVIATSIIGLFIASFVLDKEITLTKMNEWVSLVLGLVALFIGIISLFLSFYNVDQSIASQDKTVEIMRDLQLQMVEQFAGLQRDLEHKIDDSGEKTRDMIRGKYTQNSRITSSVEVQSGENSWEGSYEKVKL